MSTRQSRMDRERVRDQMYRYCPTDDTWERQHKSSVRMIRKERIPKAHWEKILALMVAGTTGVWISGIGQSEHITTPVIRTYFYVEI